MIIFLVLTSGISSSDDDGDNDSLLLSGSLELSLVFDNFDGFNFVFGPFFESILRFVGFFFVKTF